MSPREIADWLRRCPEPALSDDAPKGPAAIMRGAERRMVAALRAEVQELRAELAEQRDQSDALRDSMHKAFENLMEEIGKVTGTADRDLQIQINEIKRRLDAMAPSRIIMP